MLVAPKLADAMQLAFVFRTHCTNGQVCVLRILAWSHLYEHGLFIPATNMSRRLCRRRRGTDPGRQRRDECRFLSVILVKDMALQKPVVRILASLGYAADFFFFGGGQFPSNQIFAHNCNPVVKTNPTRSRICLAAAISTVAGHNACKLEFNA